MVVLCKTTGVVAEPSVLSARKRRYRGAPTHAHVQITWGLDLLLFLFLSRNVFKCFVGKFSLLTRPNRRWQQSRLLLLEENLPLLSFKTQGANYFVLVQKREGKQMVADISSYIVS